MHYQSQGSAGARPQKTIRLWLAGIVLVLLAILLIKFWPADFTAWFTVHEGIDAVGASLWELRYLALFLITLVASCGWPAPAAPATLAAASLASQGHMNPYLVYAAAAGGSILGDITMFLLVRYYGKTVAHFFGLDKWLNLESIKNVENAVSRLSSWVIILSRFQVQTTGAINVLAGLSHLHKRRFIRLATLGELLQTFIYTLLGYIFAESWLALYAIIGRFSLAIAAILTISMLIASKKLAGHLTRKYQ